jgi:hypothetical protein
VDPHPLTLRELVAMAEGRTRESWNHTSVVLALLANVHRDPRRRSDPFMPAEFHPYERPRAAEPMKADITLLRDVFVPRPGGGGRA